MSLISKKLLWIALACAVMASACSDDESGGDIDAGTDTGTAEFDGGVDDGGVDGG